MDLQAQLDENTPQDQPTQQRACSTSLLQDETTRRIGTLKLFNNMFDCSMDDLRIDIVSLTKSDDTGSTEQDEEDDTEDEEDDIVLIHRKAAFQSGQSSSAQDDAEEEEDSYETFGFLERREQDKSPSIGRRIGLIAPSSSIFASSTFSSWVAEPLNRSFSKMSSGLKTHLLSWQESWERLADEQVLVVTACTSAEQSKRAASSSRRSHSARKVVQCASAPAVSRRSSSNKTLWKSVKRSFFPTTRPSTPPSPAFMAFQEDLYDGNSAGRTKIQVELVPLRSTGSQEADIDCGAQEGVSYELSWVGGDYDYRPTPSGSWSLDDDSIPPPFPFRRV